MTCATRALASYEERGLGGGDPLQLRLIALAAAELLTSQHVVRVGQCADGHGYGWLFVDSTKNHSRR